MAIKINGTVVIDDSQQFTNINSIIFPGGTQTSAGGGGGSVSSTISSSGSLLHTLNNPNLYGTGATDWFGAAIDVCGNYAIVGAYLEDDPGGQSSGKAYIFDLTTGSLMHVLNNPSVYSTSDADRFGESVAISNKYAIVGAPYEDYASGVNWGGIVYVFDVLTGELLRSITQPDASIFQNSYFGRSVSIYEDFIFVTAPSSSNIGQGWVISASTGALIRSINNPGGSGTTPFGQSTSIFKNLIIVGNTGYDDATGSDSGRAYVFDINTGSLVYTLANPDSHSSDSPTGDQFGYDVAINDTYILVSAPYEYDNQGQFGTETSQAGKVYVYSTTTGSLIRTLENPNPYSTSNSDLFGISVSLFGEWAAIGASYEDESTATDSGKVYLINVNTGVVETILSNPNSYSSGSGDRFGSTTAISKNFILGGAPEEDSVNGGDSGAVYVFNLNKIINLNNINSITFSNGSNFNEIEKLLEPAHSQGELLHVLNNPNSYSTSANDYFGNSVAISNNRIIVGAQFEDQLNGFNSGAAYIFDATSGALIHTLSNPSSYSTRDNDSFGSSVAISGKYCIVGAPEEDPGNRSGAGVAYVFDVITGGLIHTLIENAGNSNTFDNFGSSIAMTDKYAVFGLRADDQSGTSAGIAYIYDVISGDLVHTLLNPNSFSTADNDQFGSSVDISGDYAIIGAPGESSADGLSSGAAYVFDVRRGSLRYTVTNPNAYSTSNGDLFGNSVAISEKYFAVSAIGESSPNLPDGTSGSSAGKVYVFDLNTGALLYTLDNPSVYGLINNDQFGNSLSITNDYCVVGCRKATSVSGFQSESGEVFIFDIKTGALLSVIGNPNTFGTAAGDNFGFSIAVSDNYIVSAAYLEDDTGNTDSGKVYVLAIKDLTKLDKLITLVE